MVSNTRRTGGNIRREQTRQKVPYKRNYGEDPEEAACEEAEKKEESFNEEGKNIKTEDLKMPFGLDLDILKNFDSDKILILALLAMIYKDDGNKKLMMALAYLLT